VTTNARIWFPTWVRILIAERRATRRVRLMPTRSWSRLAMQCGPPASTDRPRDLTVAQARVRKCTQARGVLGAVVVEPAFTFGP
jgi:hypothetical protein